MLTYEQQYIINLRKILETGTKEKNERTGITTLRLPSTQIIVDLQDEFPILKSKKVFWKSAVDEILWIMQKQSNNVRDLNSKIWNQWADEDGSIGKTYGYQIGKSVEDQEYYYSNQVDYVLTRLKNNPSDRQCVINMWNVQDLGEMNLPPCVYSSVWSIINKRLNCMVVQRSADYPVGVPFNTLQYAALTHMFARHLGVEPGILTYVMADSHIYENQIEGVKQQLENYSHMAFTEKFQKSQLVFEKDAPTDFWKVGLEHMDIENYNPCPPIKYEIAV